MTTINLYKFVTKHGLEYGWCDGVVYLIVPIYLIEDFNKLVRKRIIDDGLECTMKDTHFVFTTFGDFCENEDIDTNEVFHPKGWDYHKEL